MRIIQVKYTPTPEVLAMMTDFQAMANHLLAYALHKRIKSAFELREVQYDWFEAHYGGRYAVHYLHSACSFACGTAAGWRKVGKARMPHLGHPIARLDQGLVKVKRKDERGIRLQITLAPYHYVYLDLSINHKKWKGWSKCKLGEITIRMDGVDLPFQYAEDKVPSERLAGVDLNFDHADVATSDGEMFVVDLKPLTTIQKNMKRKRESIQRQIPKNLKKQRQVLGKYKKREQNRVKQVIEDKSRELSQRVGDADIIFEDLKTTSGELLRDAKGNKFRAKLSSWAHGRLQGRTEAKHPHHTDYVYARGTSSTCAFDRTRVTHPEWRLSVCKKHGKLDRDRNAAVNILERGRKYLRGGLFPPSVWASLLEQSVPGNDGAETSRTGHENRSDAMIGDATNVNARATLLSRRQKQPQARMHRQHYNRTRT